MTDDEASPEDAADGREVGQLLAAGAMIIAMTDRDVASRVGHACSVTLLLPNGQMRVLTGDHDLLASCGGCVTAELR